MQHTLCSTLSTTLACTFCQLSDMLHLPHAATVTHLLFQRLIQLVPQILQLRIIGPSITRCASAMPCANCAATTLTALQRLNLGLQGGPLVLPRPAQCRPPNKMVVRHSANKQTHLPQQRAWCSTHGAACSAPQGCSSALTKLNSHTSSICSIRPQLRGQGSSAQPTCTAAGSAPQTRPAGSSSQ